MPRHFRYTPQDTSDGTRMNISRHVPEGFIDSVATRLEDQDPPDWLAIRNGADEIFDCVETYLAAKRRKADRDNLAKMIELRVVEPPPREVQFFLRAYHEGVIILSPGDPDESSDPTLEFTGYITGDGDIRKAALIAHY